MYGTVGKDGALVPKLVEGEVNREQGPKFKMPHVEEQHVQATVLIRQAATLNVVKVSYIQYL